MAVLVMCCCMMMLLNSSQAVWSETSSYQRDGDIIIGGMFPLHYQAIRTDGYSLQQEPSEPVCRNYNFLGFRWMQAMIYAIDEINNSSDLLLNAKLGFQIFDTCNTLSRVASQAIEITSKHQDKPVMAVVGPTNSDNSIGAANILGVYDLLQISYGGTSRRLSNKNLYNSFLRTIPNDDEQAVAMVDLLLHFNWTWVGAIAGNNEYGRGGITKFIDTAKENGICVEMIKYVDENMSEEEITSVASDVKRFNATVFVVFSSSLSFTNLSKELNAQNVTDKIWIASEAWATSSKVLEAGGRALHGTLGIAIQSGPMENYKSHLESVSPETQSTSPFIQEFWEESFSCACHADVCTYNGETKDLHTHKSNDVTRCTGNEDIKKIPNPKASSYLNWAVDELEKSYTTYLAVYAIAHALHNIETCKEGQGLLADGKCPKLTNLKHWQLLLYTKNVSFPFGGDHLDFEFNKDGDPNATYKLINWLPQADGNVTFKCIGNYSRNRAPKWKIVEDNISWAAINQTENNVYELSNFTIPTSVCSKPCKPGYYMRKLSSKCCYKCLTCKMGEYSTDINQPYCQRCNETFTSNENRTGCVSKREEYLRWDSAFGIVITCCTSIGIVLTLLAAAVFIRFWTTPIVKATNREISFFLFVAIVSCFTTPLFYITKPTNWSCRAREVVFLLSFTACISAILVKTLRVVTVFNSSRFIKQRKLNTYLKEHRQILFVLLLCLGQFILCIVWLVIQPPAVTIDASDETFVVVQCDVGPLGIVISVNVYVVLLALVAFVMAFRARKLPENFNEAKFVTFAMLIFFIVWISFIPAYLSTKGHLQSVCYSFAILASTFGILFCIFFPKVYVMVAAPSRNTIEHVRINTVNHAFRSATRSIQYRMKMDNLSSSDKPLQTTLTCLSEEASDNNNPANVTMRQLHAKKRKRPQNNNKHIYVDKTTPEQAPESTSSNELDIEINHEVATATVTRPGTGGTNHTDALHSSASFDLTLRVNVLARKRRKLQRCMSEDLTIAPVRHDYRFNSSQPNLGSQSLRRVPMKKSLSEKRMKLN